MFSTDPCPDVVSREKILVIKLGALGDWVLATGPFAAIRAHHPSAEITLLTLAEFADWGARCGWFDEIWIDDRPGWTRPFRWLHLRRKMNAASFSRVYDLQTSDRSSAYFHLLSRSRRPQWSGIARGSSHPHDNPKRDLMHTMDRQIDQLAIAGISEAPAPSLEWLDAEIDGLVPESEFALLVPGGSAHRPAKRWPADCYAKLARALADQGITPVLIGASAEADILGSIVDAAPAAVNLAGRTSLDQIAALARRAHVAIGNDTGPMHIIATAGSPSLVLFSGDSDPALCAPCGRAVQVLRETRLTDLPVDAVLEALRAVSARA